MVLKKKSNNYAFYASLLDGSCHLAAWGQTRNASIHEWQQQIPYRFFITSQSSVEPYEEKTIVINHEYYGKKSEEANQWLQAHNLPNAIVPFKLSTAARAFVEGEVSPKNMTAKQVASINETLLSFLTGPGGQEHKPLPSISKLASFFGTYRDADYLACALGQLHTQNKETFSPRRGHIALMMGILLPGGAERQVCNLALGLKRNGWTPTVLVYEAGTRETAHYRHFLEKHDIHYEMITPEGDETLAALSDLPDDVLMALWHLRAEFVLRTALTFKALRRLRPELVIGYLDWQNIYSGLGGMMAGVPHILMSGLNVAPPTFPHHFDAVCDDFNEVYKILLKHPCCSMSNNSIVGAKDYAAWLGINPQEISIAYNCATEAFLPVPSSDLLESKRQSLGLHKDQPVVLGVFRLDHEKRPHDFVDVVAALHKKHPNLKAFLCGEGALRDELLAFLCQKGLQEVIHLPGVVDDVPVMMRVATVMLHTAQVEGLPNALLEAQACGLPIVTTDCGGAKECLSPEGLAYVCEVGDTHKLTRYCDELLNDSEQRNQLAIQGHKNVQAQFSIATLTEDTLAAVGFPPEMGSKH